LSKSLNRGFATLVAGALGLGAQQLASLFGDKGDPIVLGILVFLLGILLIYRQKQHTISQSVICYLSDSAKEVISKIKNDSTGN